MRLDPRALETHLPLALMLLLVGGVYYPLTRIFFVADDFSNMLTIVEKGALEFILQPFGGHMLMVRNAAFWLHFQLFGFASEGYGWVSFLTHLVNAWLFYRVGRTLTKEPAFGALGAAIWGTCPLLEGALGWYSVYGQVLSGTALLFVLDRAARWEEVKGPLGGREATLWAAVLLGGAASFGVGIAIAISFPLSAALLLPRAARGRAAVTVLALLPFVVVLAYFATRRLYAHFYPMPLAELVMHGVAFSAFLPILQLSAHLVAVGAIALLEGFAFDPAGYPASAMVPLVVFAGLLAAGALRSDALGRRRILGMLVLAFAVYAFIGVGRANVYLMFGVPLADAGKTLRYHYAATIPLAMALLLSLSVVARNLRLPLRAKSIPLVAWALTSTVLLTVSGWRLNEYQGQRAYVEQVLAIIEATASTVPPGEEVLIQNRPLPQLLTGPALSYRDIPGWAALFILARPSNVVAGRRVRFVQSAEHAQMFEPRTPRVAAFFAPPGTPNAR